MGGRLSMPRGPAGTTEISRPIKPSGRINSRTLVAPAAAFTMACILFVYARTSIHAAKANAQRHRDHDSGGQGLDLLTESRRRHGLAEQVKDDSSKAANYGNLGELASEARAQLLGEKKRKKEAVTEEETSPAKRQPEDKLKAAMRKRADEE